MMTGDSQTYSVEKPAELLHVKSCDCASNGYITLFPANDAVHCSILSSLYMP